MAKKYKILIIFFVGFIVFSIGVAVYAKTQVDYSVHFIDTGQSDCILIKAGAKNYLIDTGAPYYSARIIRYLNRQNVNTIDTIILTHYHDDHYGCLNDILKVIKVSKVYLPVSDDKMKSKIYKDVLMNHASVHFMEDGWKLNEGKMHLKIIAPQDTILESINNNSIIIYGEIDGIKYFFASDCEKSEQKYILERYDIKPCDVLKYPHHGLDTGITVEMLNKLKPQVAIVTCNGRESPDKSTMKKIENKGVKIFRYDKDGDIQVNKGVVLTAKSYKRLNLLKGKFLFKN